MSDNKKYCKYCGEKIDSDCIVCPKCGRQLKKVDKKTSVQKNENSLDNKSQDKPKFYVQTWFMWVMLIIFAPVGVFLMWRFHPEMKKGLKIALTIIFGIIFLVFCLSSGEDSDSTSSDSETDYYKKNKEKTVEVVDFSQMTKADVQTWCDENKMNCNFKDEYSDSVEEGNFIEQSVEGTKKVYEGESITIYYSLGKEPTVSQKNSLKKAQSYLRYSAFSRQGLIEQLEYEGFSNEDAVYAVDRVGADWKEQAVKKGKSYLNYSAFSRQGLIEQLEYEGFTYDEAVYGVEQNGL